MQDKGQPLFPIPETSLPRGRGHSQRRPGHTREAGRAKDKPYVWLMQVSWMFLVTAS